MEWGTNHPTVSPNDAAGKCEGGKYKRGVTHDYRILRKTASNTHDRCRVLEKLPEIFKLVRDQAFP